MLLGNIYVGDTSNHRVRKITVSTGIITTIAGTGTGGYSVDKVSATSAALYYPAGVALDSSGMLYYTYYLNFLSFISIIRQRVHR